MKSLKKTNLIIAGLIAITLMSVGTSGTTVNDDTDDVWKQEISTSGYSWSETSSRDDVDVTDVSYTINGSEVTATLTVNGQIQNSASHSYQIYLVNSSGKYFVYYTYGSGAWVGQDSYYGEYGSLTNPVSDDTFTATFEIDHPEDDFDVYGVATESDSAMEAYYDYAPDSYGPYYSSGSEDDSSDDDADDTTDDDNNGLDNGDYQDYMDNLTSLQDAFVESETDPSTETPTDTSIQVSIDDAKYDIDLGSQKTSIDVDISGTTNGVDHCKLCLVNYYSDGTHDQSYIWMGEFDLTSIFNNFGSMSGTPDLDSYHFKSLSDNWQTWEFKMKGSIDTTNMDSSNIVPMDSNNTKTLTETTVYVRAFKDANETLWNQDSKIITFDSTSPLDEDKAGDGGNDTGDGDDGGGGIPGFETVFLIAAIGIALILLKRKNKK